LTKRTDLKVTIERLYQSNNPRSGNALDTVFLHLETLKGKDMKRNIFWTAWGVVGLMFLLSASLKSFAAEIRKRVDANEHKYVSEEPRTETNSAAGL